MERRRANSHGLSLYHLLLLFLQHNPIERLQAAQRVSGGRKQRKQESALPQLPTKTVAIVLVVQGILVAFATTLLIYQFPPAANAKSQQQWYAIFQRVDRLYQAKYGNQSSK